MNFPSDLKYSKDHEWLRVEGEFGFVGITDFAQRELGDIVFIDVNKETKTFLANQEFGSVEAVKTVSEIYMPVGGEIVEINAGIESNPEYVNEDPYEKGWMVKIKITDSSEANALMGADEYKKMIGEE